MWDMSNTMNTIEGFDLSNLISDLKGREGIITLSESPDSHMSDRVKNTTSTKAIHWLYWLCNEETLRGRSAWNGKEERGNKTSHDRPAQSAKKKEHVRLIIRKMTCEGNEYLILKILFRKTGWRRPQV